MKHHAKSPRTLALYVTRRGVAFVLFTSPLTPHDWGTKEVRGTNKHVDCMRIAKQLIDIFQPNVLVIEDVHEHGSRRFPRIVRLHRAITVYAERRALAMEAYSRRAIRETFSRIGASTKYEISCVIVRMIPAFSGWLPHKRKPWEAEASAQGVFDAMSLGLTFFASTKRLDIAQAMKGQSEASSLAEF